MFDLERGPFIQIIPGELGIFCIPNMVSACLCLWSLYGCTREKFMDSPRTQSMHKLSFILILSIFVDKCHFAFFCSSTVQSLYKMVSLSSFHFLICDLHPASESKNRIHLLNV